MTVFRHSLEFFHSVYKLADDIAKLVSTSPSWPTEDFARSQLDLITSDNAKLLKAIADIQSKLANGIFPDVEPVRSFFTLVKTIASAVKDGVEGIRTMLILVDQINYAHNKYWESVDVALAENGEYKVCLAECTNDDDDDDDDDNNDGGSDNGSDPGGGGGGGGGGGNLPDPPGGDSGGGGSSSTVNSHDPNAKTGTAGFGLQGFIAQDRTLSYRVDFENDQNATAPAQQVDITDQLDPGLDWSTFQLTEVGFGDTIISIPAGSQYFATTVPMSYNGRTFNVAIQLGLSQATGVVYAHFFSIDPSTQLPPDVLAGFLPPENGTGRGQGHFSYTVRARASLPTGTQIRNVAYISFDQQVTISTDQISTEDPSLGVDPNKQSLNTIDAGSPTSNVTQLPAITTTADIPVSWSGADDLGGSGIATYDVYVATDGGPFIPWLLGTTLTQSAFAGDNGHTYSFYSVVSDNVGHRQPVPTVAQATTTVHTQEVTTLSSVSGAGVYGGNVTLTATLTVGGAPLPGKTVVFSRHDGAGDTVLGSAVTDASGVATLGGVGLGLHAGMYVEFVRATFEADADHEGAEGLGDLAVSRAALTITTDDVARFYGDSNPAFGTRYDGFAAGDGPGSLLGTLAFTTSEPASGLAPADDYAVMPSGLHSPDYTITFVAGTLHVAPRALVITAAAAGKSYGAADPHFSATYAGFVAGEDEGVLGGELAFTTSEPAVGHAPVGDYLITPSGLSSGNYAIEFRPGTLTVSPAALTVAVDDASRTYGDPNPPSSVSYHGFADGETPSSLAGTLSLLTIATPASNVGTYDVTAGGLTSNNYSISYISGRLSVTPAPLVVTPGNESRLYGAVNPALGGSVVGVRNGDLITASYATVATAVSDVGDYAITASLSGAQLANYSLTLDTGVLTIHPVPLMIRAEDKSKVYGAGLPAFTASYSGFVIGQGPDVLGGVLSFGTAAQASSPVGDYPVTPAGLTSSNYAVELVAGTLHVTPAPLFITANDKVKVSGAALPPLTVSYAGFVNGDGPDDLTMPVSLSTDASAGSPVGQYVILASGAASPDYVISYIAGTLIVEKAVTAITLSVSMTSPLYGVDALTLVSDVTVVAPGAGTPTGYIDLLDERGTLLARVDVAVGTATLDSDALAPGSHTLQAIFSGDDRFLDSSAITAVTVVAPSSLSGLVYKDLDNDGQVGFGEGGIAGVPIRLTGTDDLGRAVDLALATDDDGAYVFQYLRPGYYRITETQPAGYTQGINIVGTGGGTVSGDQFAVDLAADLAAMNYNFGERPLAVEPVRSGQAAGIGFWNNKNGQALIKALNGGVGTQLGDWLAANFPNMFGARGRSNNLAGKNNAEVAMFFQSRFVQHDKLDAQVLATALAVYVTDVHLNPARVGSQHGFVIDETGLGSATFSVGSNGAAFGVVNDTTMTVMDLLLATDAQAVDGMLYNSDVVKQKKAKNIYAAINQVGGI